MPEDKAPTPKIPENYVVLERKSAFSQQLGTFYVPANQTRADATICVGMVLKERHGGAPGRGHGAVALIFLDEVMGRAASWSTDKLCVTASFTTHFCASTRINTFIYAKARVRKRGATMVFVDAELFDQSERLISTATGIWSITKETVPD